MNEHRPSRSLSKRDQGLLVQLADGALTGRRRARAEARAGAIPDAQALIDRQRRVARALGAAHAPAPIAPVSSSWRRTAWRLPAAAIAATLILFLVLVPGGDRSTVERAADLAQSRATETAPPGDGAVLRADVDGVAFPEWDREFGWHEIGMRRDVLDGRRTTTVFYAHAGHRLAYTIISGTPLPRPAGARVVRRAGLEIALYRDPDHGGHHIAVFERGGRTCVLAGHVRRIDTLLELAAWRGDGRIRS